jgi:8-oxo-dGTP pyrophosphatase MutT (NUDIX family)
MPERINGDDGPMWVAVAAIVVRGNRVLAMRRSSGRPGAGLWETVSGRVKPGEDPREALAREIVEETGLSVRLVARPIDVYAASRGGEPMTVVAFRGDHVSGEVVLSDEHDAFAWLTEDEFARTSTLHRLVEATRRALALGAE